MQRPPSETLYVDLGLPSGNRWAVANLDVTGPYYFQQSPFQYECSFFSWGNVTPHNPISETAFEYDWGGVNSAVPYYEGQPYGSTPGAQLTADIPLTMDAAKQLLGGPWRTPSRADFAEILANCDYIDADGEIIPSDVASKLTTVNGVVGLRLRSRNNDAIIFFPSTGYGEGLSLVQRASSTFYWTLSYYSARGCYAFWLRTGYSATVPRNFRYPGCPIRPIWNPRDLRG